MATNVYFNNFPNSQVTSEQLLVEDLVIEAMKIYGMDVYYLPRTSRDQVDMLYGEDPLKQYVTAHSIEVYLENITGMDGEGDFISKFGLEIKDEITILMSRQRFKYVTGASNLVRPREGDLIYVPLVQNFFEITFVEHENDQAMFYTLGRGRGGNVYVYAVKLKQFVFSEEIIKTGIAEVDNQIRDSYARTLITLTSGSGTFAKDEVVYQGSNISVATAQAVVYNYVTNTSIDVIQLKGTFASGNVRGNTSNSNWVISTISETARMNTAFENIYDNDLIENESDAITDWTETNPFGGD